MSERQVSEVALGSNRTFSTLEIRAAGVFAPNFSFHDVYREMLRAQGSAGDIQHKSMQRVILSGTPWQTSDFSLGGKYLFTWRHYRKP